MQRRTFFKASIALSVGLIAWRQGVLVPAKEQSQKISEFTFLEKRDIILMTALLPSLLPFKQWPIEEIAKMSQDLDRTLSFMTRSTQEEIRQLFDLFHLKPFLWWHGVSRLERANPVDISKLLERMANSRLSDFRAASAALNELLCGVYYASPSTDLELSYAPPLDLI